MSLPASRVLTILTNARSGTDAGNDSPGGKAPAAPAARGKKKTAAADGEPTPNKKRKTTGGRPKAVKTEIPEEDEADMGGVTPINPVKDEASGPDT